MKTLTYRDILINVGNAYFARGDAYYKKGYVRSLVVERENDGIMNFEARLKAVAIIFMIKQLSST